MRGRRAELKAGDSSDVSLPRLPPHLPKSMSAEWVAVTEDLKRRGLLHASMFSILASYFTAVWTVEECRKALRKGILVKTKNGEPKAHPAAGMLAKHQDIIARLGAELGLTPAARSRKGLQGPEAHTDEDAPPGLDL